MEESLTNIVPETIKGPDSAKWEMEDTIATAATCPISF